MHVRIILSVELRLESHQVVNQTSVGLLISFLSNIFIHACRENDNSIMSYSLYPPI